MFTVRPMRAAEWPVYRQLRLQALRDAPDAFGSTYAAEGVGADAHWAARLRVVESSGRDLALVAETAHGPCGLVWCKVSADDPTVANLYQMWVAPEARGHGVGRALLAEALDWAAAAGVRHVHLGVTVGDSPARRLYVSMGFRPVGEPTPLREGSAQLAQDMVCALGDAPVP